MRIDFTGLPMEELILTLRHLGLGLLEELLDRTGEPGEELEEKPQPELWKYFSPEETGLLARAGVWKVKRSLKTGRIPRDMRNELSRALKKIFTKCIAGKMKSVKWQIGISNRVALAIDGTPGAVLPEALWPAAAEAAWNDPGFQFTAAMKIHDWLRCTSLLVPYEPPDPRLSANTFWVLIALAKIKPIRFRWWFSRKERAAVRVERRVQQEANWRIMVNEWADFWDQWVIRLASQRWPSGFGQLDPRLCKALLALPLLDTTAMTKLCRGKRKRVMKFSVRPLLEQWFDKLDGIRRLRITPKTRRKYALLNLTAPGWENRVPGFFTTAKKDFSHGQTRKDTDKQK